MAEATHEYRAHTTWTGNTGDGTASYDGYGRDYEFAVDGKPVLRGSADPLFRGDPNLHNPEDLFLAALSGCHLLSYLALCARKGIRVLAYEDSVSGTLSLRGNGPARFTEVRLAPVVTIADDDDAELAMRLHNDAHAQCFIANSCSVPVLHDPVIRTAAAPTART
ncbi:MAG TPA: OsmC family protein [Longimicrobiales bacterium]|nr:OsmC family protein [Longimicrobiales bacterium]